MNNWKDFNPFGGANDPKSMNPSIEKYVKNILSQSMPSSFLPDLFNETEEKDEPDFEEEVHQPKENYQVFEMHDYVVVRVNIDVSVHVRDLKIYHTSNQLTIEGNPNQHDKQVISLPSLVQHKGTKAIFRNHILEIKMTKERDYRLTQIDIQRG